MKKRVAIATWVGNTSLNYGSVLQTTALQKLIRDCGYESLTVNHRYSTPTCKSVARKHMKDRIRELGFMYLLSLIKFFFFFKKNIKLSRACFSDEDVIQLCKKKVDILLCGSDAIWKDIWIRPLFLWDYDELRLLPAISYAASVQKGNIAYENMEHALEHFVALSGREEKVGELLENYTEKIVETVLDPTLSVEEDYWKHLAGRRRIKEEYILCYFISEAELHHLSVEKVKKKYGVEKLVYINTDVIDKSIRTYTDYQGNVYKKVVGPREFLSLFKYANAICTDSFHGMCFSIVFRKDFFIYSRDMLWKIEEDYRFLDLMKRLNIENRIINKNADIEKLSSICYDEVEHALYKERKKSLEFLENALSKC